MPNNDSIKNAALAIDDELAMEALAKRPEFEELNPDLQNVSKDTWIYSYYEYKNKRFSYIIKFIAAFAISAFFLEVFIGIIISSIIPMIYDATVPFVVPIVLGASIGGVYLMERLEKEKAAQKAVNIHQKEIQSGMKEKSEMEEQKPIRPFDVPPQDD